MYFHFGNVLVFTLLGLGLCAFHMILRSFLRPHNPETKKLTTYECGELPTGSAWINFNIRFYLVALVFVIFDIEVAFIYPVAVAFRDFVLAGNGLFALAEIFLFLGILSVGLVYVWVKRDLEWIKRVEPQDDVEQQQEHALPKAA
jgi:NADH-quinone oxidoreductase subunit A